MRIGVNALYLIPGGVGGTEIYLRRLLQALAEIDTSNEYWVFTNAETGADLVPAKPNFHHAPQNVRASVRPARILWEQTMLPLAVRRLRMQVLLNPGFTAPIITGVPQVTVFHDLQHKRHPEYFRWWDLPFWRMLLFLAVHRSRTVIAVSESTRQDLHRFYSLAPACVRVVPHGVEKEFFRLPRMPDDAHPFLLAVSTLHPHKNLDTLIRAFAQFWQGKSQWRLVIVGLRGFYTAELEALRSSLRLEQSVIFTGWIPREELRSLFATAQAFVYPSLFEGFGMPVLEALAAGIPTACSHREPMASIAGKAALLFDPTDVQAMYDALLQITGDVSLRRELAESGPARAAHYSWERAARETLSALRESVRP